MPIVLADTITKSGPESLSAVIVSGSHGGVYPAYLACKAGAKAVILNDAGMGKDNAGIGCIDYCQSSGVAAATVAHNSARIGDTEDMMQRGIISAVNEIAAALGCRRDMSCTEAARLMEQAMDIKPLPGQAYAEARTTLSAESGKRRVLALDSVSLVQAEDIDQIILTGSHGGLVGGNPAMALRVDAFAAIYNDAGIGIDNAGISRLPALQERGIAAATVDCRSARIGNAHSTYYDGILSALNPTAERLGGKKGMPARVFVDQVLNSAGA